MHTVYKLATVTEDAENLKLDCPKYAGGRSETEV